MQHDVYVGAAVADVNNVVGADLRAGLQLIENEYFSIACSCASDRLDLAVVFIKKLGSKNMIFGNNSLECRLNHFNWRGGQNVKIEMVAGNPTLKNLIKQRDVFFQANALSDFIQMLFAHATLELGIVQQQIGKLSTLLHQVQPCHACGFALEFSRRNSDQFGEHVARVVEGKRLVEVACKNELFAIGVIHVPIRLWRRLKDK